MPWWTQLAAHPGISYLLTEGPSSSADSAGSLTAPILSTGLVGLFLVILGWLYFRGWRLISPAAEKELREKTRAEARGDLEAENARLREDHRQAEERWENERRQLEQQRDEALRFLTSSLVPLITNFTSATQNLLPILQRLVTDLSIGGSRRSRQGP